MKRLIASAVVTLALVLGAGSLANAQATFKISFKFEAGGKKFPAGEYRVARKDDSQITLRLESTGKEAEVPFTQKLAQPNPPIEEPQLVFDAVGNFEPSYTEYFTVYLLAEVWLPGEDGLLIHTTKGAHQNQIVKGQKADK
ncbi:MAG: hypothetical protein WCC06_01910 [Candidatus Aminicenantales bacterium]